MHKDSWLSAHLYFTGGIYDAACDRVLLNVVAPLTSTCTARKWARGFFFVRYGDDGPHVRLRILGRPETLTHKVIPALDRAITQAGSFIQRVTLRQYEPEVSRYGGSDGVALAERLFQECSRHSLALLSGMDGMDRGQRLGRGLVPLIVLLSGFVRGRARPTAILQRHGASVLMALASQSSRGGAFVEHLSAAVEDARNPLQPQVATLLRGLRSNEGLPSHVLAYQTAVRAAAFEMRRLVRRRAIQLRTTATPTWTEVVSALVPSYLHMACNRFGISPAEEAYLSLAVARTWPSQSHRHSRPAPA